jgi:CSLREA domain-containing protein
MALLIAAIAHGAWALQLRSPAIVVNTTTDELNGDGDCSLREAIVAANTNAAVDGCAAGSGADTIVVPNGTYYLTLTGHPEDHAATGDLDIREEVTILGGGASSTIFDGSALDRVFHIYLSSLTLSNLRVQNGKPADTYGGGGILADYGSLKMVGVSVAHNTASKGGGIGTNGLTSSVEMADSRVSYNTGTADFLSGGGIFISGSLKATNCMIDANTTTGSEGSGGGAYVYSGGSAVIAAVNFQANFASGSGAGLFNNTSTTVEIRDSLFNSNSAMEYGAAAIHNYGALKIVNSTIAQNHAGDGKVGGIACTDGATSIHNSTIAHNDSGGVVGSNVQGVVSVKNSIVAFNGTAYGSEYNCGGNVTSLGYNLETGTTCGFTSTGDLQNTDPLLGVLQLNGGSTPTYDLLVGSPAIDAGDPSGCTEPTGLPLHEDQRGYVRPVDGDGDGARVCDMGAIEFGSGAASLKLFIGNRHELEPREAELPGGILCAGCNLPAPRHVIGIDTEFLLPWMDADVLSRTAESRDGHSAGNGSHALGAGSDRLAAPPGS